jgi:hypothetical protein
MIYKISRLIILIASILSFPFFLYTQILVGSAGHGLADDTDFIQAMIYSIITTLLVYYSNRFSEIFWFYRIVIKMILLALLFPIFLFSVLIIHDGLTRSHSFFPKYIFIPLSLVIINAGLIFVKAYMMGNLKNSDPKALS